MLIKQLAFEDANETCKEALRGLYQHSHLQEMTSVCADIGPCYLQGIALQQPLRKKLHALGRKGTCQTCGKMEHFACDYHMDLKFKKNQAGPSTIWMTCMAPWVYAHNVREESTGLMNSIHRQLDMGNL